MKDVYVILAFHAHELIWDLPEILMSYLEDGNPMKDTIHETNYIKKRKEEGRDIYRQCSDLGDRLEAPLCVEYTNELLFQIKEVWPETFAKMKQDYRRGRLYPLYGHAHHTNIALLSAEEMAQEIAWNMEYLHNLMGVPYPKYNGVFPTEDSLDYQKIDGMRSANISYVIFPQLRPGEIPFTVEGEGDYQYKPFLIETEQQNILAFHRNFSISQEIWRPITKMKRNELESQGYMLGDFPVFYNEYPMGKAEKFPISLEEGVGIYKYFLETELNRAPDKGVLVYVQDLELMDFGDIALEIMEKAWQKLRREVQDKIKIHFVTPDQYIDAVLKNEDLAQLPRVKFGQISWAPEMRVVLRPDGHYPPAGVGGIGPFDFQKTGFYQRPLIFWENGKYFCGIFDSFLAMLNISMNIPTGAQRLDEIKYHLQKEDLRTQAVLYLRLMKRACNWGWVPTEGRQKRPCLKGYLLGQLLLQLLQEYPTHLLLNPGVRTMDERNLVGIVESLKVFVDTRLDYLKYGIDQLAVTEGVDKEKAYHQIQEAQIWRTKAVEGARRAYWSWHSDSDIVQRLTGCIQGVQEFCLALFMATEHIQWIWSSGKTGFLVEKMYEYLYNLYPPLFPEILDRVDAMGPDEIKEYFAQLEQPAPKTNPLAAK